MAIEVKGPDGSVSTFPDGTPPEVIKQAMAKRFPSGMRAPQQVVFSDTGQPVGSDAQAMAYRQLNAAGGIDQTQPQGSARNPYGQRGEDVSGLNPSDFYIDRQGRVLQAPVQSAQVSQSEFGVGDNAGYLNKRGAALFTYALNPSEKSRVDWIAKNYPGAQFARDERGALVVRPKADANWMYLNRPGASATDVADIATQTALFAPANSAAKAGLSLGKNSMRVGAASAGISVAQDVATGQPIDPSKALLAGGGGIAGEYAGAGVRAIAGAAARPVQQVVSAARNRLAPQPTMTVGQAGNALGAQFAGRAGANTAQQNALDIPMTRGQTTGNFNDIAFEQAALRGARGQEAGTIMQNFAQGQADAVATTGRGLAGSQAVRNVPEAGQIVQEGLRGRDAAMRGRVGAAYDDIKASPAEIGVANLGDLPTRIKTKLEENFFSPEVMTSLNPRAKMVFGEIDRLVKSAPKAAEGETAFLPIAGIERLRQGINKAMAGAQGNDIEALRIAKNEFDGWLDDAVDNNLISGDPEALSLLKGARSLNAEWRRLYGGGRSMDGAQKIVSKLIDSGANETDAVNLLFGRAELNGSGASVGALKNIREIVGDGPEWKALKEGAVMRLMSRMERNAGGGVGNINYKALADDWRKALDGPAAPLMREMFAADEIAAMREFVAKIQKLAPPEGAVNRSNTGYEVSRLVSDAASGLLGNLKILAPITRAMDDAANINRARAATSGQIAPRVQRLPYSGSVGAAQGNILGAPSASFTEYPVN
jgi:hypothetical protein